MIQVIIIEFSVHSPTPLDTEPTAKLRILSLTICIPPPKPSLFTQYSLTIPSLQLFTTITQEHAFGVFLMILNIVDCHLKHAEGMLLCYFPNFQTSFSGEIWVIILRPIAAAAISLWL